MELEKLDFENQIILDKILEWRNNIETRMNSKNTNLITQDIFLKIIQKYKECEINPLMIRIEDKYVGIITFVSNEDKIFIGINIDPNERGKSIASLALQILTKNYKILLKKLS